MSHTNRDELAVNERTLQIEVPADRIECVRPTAQSWSVLEKCRYEEELRRGLHDSLLLQSQLREPTARTKECMSYSRKG